MIEKINPFKQIIETMKAFYYTEIFYRLRRQSTGSKFLVALIASAIACFCTFIIGGWKFGRDKAWDEIMQAMPDFTYSDGQLVCEATYDKKVDEFYLVVDTDVNAWTIAGQDKEAKGIDVTNKINKVMQDSSVDKAVFVSRTNMVMVQKRGNEISHSKEKWTDVFGLFGITGLTKAQVQGGYKRVIMMIAAILFFVVLPFRMLGVFFYAMLWAIIALLLNAIHKSEEDFTTLYWISFYMQISFMVIIALLKLFVSWRTRVTVIALLIYYIIMMSRVLKNGAPVENVSANYGGSSGFGAVQDDFTSFMRESETSMMTQNILSEVEQQETFIQPDSFQRGEAFAQPDPFRQPEESQESGTSSTE